MKIFDKATFVTERRQQNLLEKCRGFCMIKAKKKRAECRRGTAYETVRRRERYV